MPYATQQDLIDRFGEEELVQLTDRTNRPATTINVTTVEKALSDASNLADGYFASRYNLPLNSTPEILTKVISDIARFYLHGEGVDKDSPVRTGYLDSMKWLDGVSKGNITLQADGVAAASEGDGEVRFTADERVFTRDSLSGM